MTIKVTRSSVCMADDIHAPHEAVLQMPADAKIPDIMAKIIQINYLPKGYIWVLKNQKDGQEIASCYSPQKIFYKDANLSVNHIPEMCFCHVDKREAFISDEEEKYVLSLRYRLSCLIRNVFWLFVVIFLIISCSYYLLKILF